jgi:hypothetical protein
MTDADMRDVGPRPIRTLRFGENSADDLRGVTRDTRHSSCNLNLNFGGATCPSSATQMAMIAFDLSSLPVDTIVFAATLQVWTHPANASTDLHTLHRINESWQEGVGDDSGVVGGATYTERDTGVPWTTLGCGPPSCADAILGSFSLAAAGDVLSETTIDLATVQGWVDGSIANHGVVIRSMSTITGSTFNSREAPTDGERPTLVLTVQ